MTAMAETDPLSKDYRTRRGELSAFGRAFNSATILNRIQMGILAALIGVALLAAVGVLGWSLSLALVLIVAIGGILTARQYTNQHFIEPDFAFRKWIQQVCDGDLDARIDLPEDHRHYKELNFHTRNVATALNRLSTDMEALVDSQTQRLEYQNRCLELLFKLTADVSGETDRHTVYDTVCQYLADWFGNSRVAIAQVEGNALVWLAVRETASWQTLQDDDIVIGEPAEDDLRVDEISYKRVEGESVYTIVVPVHDNGYLSSVIQVNSTDYSAGNRVELDRVLTNVSDQLSLFFSKQEASARARQAQMVRDRTELAAEIHDSLAQTLLAARYQMTLLRETLGNDVSAANIEGTVEKIESSISAANTEVRELIQEYRKPLTEHRNADSIQETINQFRENTDLQVFFQTNDTMIQFTPREESVIQRIIQEALMNAEKHSGGSMVRVFLQGDQTGMRRILIEDDGEGVSDEAGATEDSQSGVHIGMSIMHDRAVSIGAILNMESEPGEGTRVSLVLPPVSKFSGVET